MDELIEEFKTTDDKVQAIDDKVQALDNKVDVKFEELKTIVKSIEEKFSRAQK